MRPVLNRPDLGLFACVSTQHKCNAKLHITPLPNTTMEEAFINLCDIVHSTYTSVLNIEPKPHDRRRIVVTVEQQGLAEILNVIRSNLNVSSWLALSTDLPGNGVHRRQNAYLARCPPQDSDPTQDLQGVPGRTQAPRAVVASGDHNKRAARGTGQRPVDILLRERAWTSHVTALHLLLRSHEPLHTQYFFPPKKTALFFTAAPSSCWQPS